MEIERATTAILDPLVDLWLDLAANQRSHGSHLCVEANRNHIRESLSQRLVTGGVFVARADGEAATGASTDSSAALLGFVSFYPESGGYEQDIDRGVVENIYVVPERRGEGIGSALLGAAEDALAAGGVAAVTLESMADNARARQFYRRHGYEPHRVAFERRLERETDTNPDGG